MSNNKQSMKLYTEEHILQAFKDGFLTAINEGSLDYINEYADEITPIELPSNEEIEREARLFCNIKESLEIDEEERYYRDFQKYDGFKACAKWMRDKIQGGNK